LSPVMRVGAQIGEVIGAHKQGNRKQRKQEVKALLQDARLSDVDRIYDAYPHQLSGGQLHRIVIAQALACGPKLVIADEPTRALDATVQSELLHLLKQINRERKTSFIFITHNPALLAGFADRILVMYAGHIIEQGRTAQIFRDPLHPYTKALLQSAPQRMTGRLTPTRHLPVIAGSPPNMSHAMEGCSFAPRCSERMEVCRSQYPQEFMPAEARRVSCFMYGN
jgi:peptide/nickel transport system ATP-binding protein